MFSNDFMCCIQCLIYVCISVQRLSFAASTTASFATTMGTVPVGPVSVRTRTPDTTALATMAVSVGEIPVHVEFLTCQACVGH